MMMYGNNILKYFFILLINVAGTAVWAVPASPVSVTVETLNAAPAFGDSMSFICTVSAPLDVIVSAPAIATTSTGLDISNHWQKTIETTDSSVSTSYGFLTYVLSPDSLTFGPVGVKYFTANGDSGFAFAQALKLPVTGMIENPEEPEPARPDRLPFHLSSHGLPLWLWGLVIFALALILYFVYRRLRANKSSISQVFEAIPTDEIEEFEKIRRLHLPDHGKIKEHYILISDAMRAFLYRKMAFDAIYETSYEILQQLASNDIDDNTFNAIRHVFSETDMVKFAKYTPSDEDTNSLIDRAILPVRSVLEIIEKEETRLKRLELEKNEVSENALNESEGDA